MKGELKERKTGASSSATPPPPQKRDKKRAEKREGGSSSPSESKLKFILAGVVMLWMFVYYFKPQLFHGVKVNHKQNLYNDVAKNLNVLNGLKNISRYELNQGQCHGKSVLVGYNTNLDLIVDSVDLLSGLAIERAPAQAHDSINSLQEFEATFSYYFERGSAAERFVESEEDWTKILRVANGLEKKVYFTGGNAGIMANILAKEGCNVYLSGVVGPVLQGLLDPRIKFIPNEPESSDDEVHLIMEYNANTEYHGVRPPRSNRFIVSRDLSNSKMLTMEQLHKSIPTLSPKPDILLLSGLHLLTSTSQLSRVDALMSEIAKVPFSADPERFLNSEHNIPIHLELASISDSAYMKSLAKKVIPHFDSIGLNEQELGFLYLTTGGSKYAAHDFVAPDVNVAVHAIKHIFSNLIFPDTDTSNGLLPELRMTSRIHFHYLTYHIIAIKDGYAAHWRSPAASVSAVAASTLEATKNACGFNQISVKLPAAFEVDYDFTPGSSKTITIDEKAPVSHWSDRGITFFIAPVLVCDNPQKTVGLGDSISTVSLLYQTVKH